jgi:hypothetical protein
VLRSGVVALAVAPARLADAVALLLPLLAVLLAVPDALGATVPVISTRCPTYLATSWPLSRYMLGVVLARAPLEEAPAVVDPPTLPELFPDVPVAPLDPADAVISMNSPFTPRSMQPVTVSGLAAVRVDVDAGSCVRAPGVPTPCEPLCTGDCVGACGVA